MSIVFFVFSSILHGLQFEILEAINIPPADPIEGLPTHSLFWLSEKRGKAFFVFDGFFFASRIQTISEPVFLIKFLMEMLFLLLPKHLTF